MGSDLYMNPPKPAEYRAHWEKVGNLDICIVERRDEMVDRGEWKEVWRGNPNPDVKAAFKAMRFELPAKPRTLEAYQILETRLRAHIDRLKTDLVLRESYSGDPDPRGTQMLRKIVQQLETLIA